MKLSYIDRLRLEAAYIRHLEFLAGCHHPEAHTLFYISIHQPYMSYNALIRIKIRVKNQRAKLLIIRTLRSRNIVHNAFQDFFYTFAGLCRCHYRRRYIQSYTVFYLLFHLLRFSARKIDLIDDWDYIEVIFHRHIYISDCLCLYALRGIYDKQCALTCSQRPGNLVVEVYVPRCVYKVQLIHLAVLCPVIKPYSLCLDRDTAFTLKVHIVQYLIFHLTFR